MCAAQIKAKKVFIASFNMRSFMPAAAVSWHLAHKRSSPNNQMCCQQAVRFDKHIASLA
jgi:hypothetical protein